MTTDAAQCPYCHKMVATSRLPYHIAELHPAPPQGFPEPRHRAHWGHKIRKEPCAVCGELVATNWTQRHMEKYHNGEAMSKQRTPTLSDYDIHKIVVEYEQAGARENAAYFVAIAVRDRYESLIDELERRIAEMERLHKCQG